MRVENVSERQYDITAGGKTVSIPRGQGGEDGKQNGAADVDDDFLKLAKKDPWVVAIFDSGDLVEKAAKASAPKVEPAK